MNPVYVVEQGTKVRINNGCIQIEKDEGIQSTVLFRSPIALVSQVVLFGNVGLTTPAIALFLEKEIDVVFLSAHGEYRGRLMNKVSAHVTLRKSQYLSADSADFCLLMAGCFVRAKLQHQKTLLLRHNRELASASIEKDVEMIRQALSVLENKICLNSLRGAEGKAAASYIHGFRQFFSPEWKFERRERRPCPDPVNSLLSFGYTLLYHNALSAVEAVGLDPFAGFLHVDVYNRASLGLDLMEEFRPVVDGVVLWCCRSGQITPADFDIVGNTCLIKDPAKKILIRAFEERMNSSYTHPVAGKKMTMRQCLMEQARQIVHCIQSAPADPCFVPMGFR